MRRVLLALVVVTGCQAAPPAQPPAPRACPAPTVAAPPPLPRLVDPARLRAAYFAERAARLDRDAVLQKCNEQLSGLQ